MRTKLMLTCRLLFLAVLVFIATSASASPKYSLDMSYLGLYESNIYHAYLDTQQVGAQLNELSARGSALFTQSDRLTHRFDAYTNFDLYINYGNRNRSSFGLAYLPMLKYARRASVHLDLDISRRNRDLVSDAGEYLNRNLGQTVLGIKATNRVSMGIFRAEQSFEYSDHNYDDSYDTNGVRLASYDYHFWQGSGSVRMRITRNVSLTGEIGYEKRYYDERKTYPIAKGPVKGYGVIREYEEWVEGLTLQTELSRSIELDLIVEYTDRTDNFEDFYGYQQWKYGVRSKIDISRRDELKIAFDLRTKDYPNYWTKNTGRNGRVSIDYATFELENNYALASGIDLTAYVKNFNKVSNERYVPGIAVPSYDYQDFSVGLGLAFEL
jgi:hypothetical protein